jgi:poly(3-hydroxybutyrate) depolymerase
MLRSRLLVVAALAASLAAPARPRAQALPNIALAQVRYATLKATARPEGDLKREIDAIDQALGEALRSGHTGEARRLLAKGTTLLSGRPWGEVLDFTHSLVLRSDRVFVDPSTPYTVRVEQIYAPALALSSSLTAQVRVRQVVRPAVASGGARVGPIEKDVGSFPGVARDLREAPFVVDLDLSGVPDGRHVVEVEVLDGERSLGTCSLAIESRAGLDARLAGLETGAKTLPAPAASLRADVLYPVDYVRRVNRGRIEMGAFDAGREVAAAEATLAAARAGKDPFTGRVGDLERHYLLEEAGEIMPYRLYVPRAYSGRQALPLVVALHGLGADQSSFFTAYGQRLPALAEERGYLVVAPLGYRVDGAYGFSLAVSTQDAAQKRKREMSEADVLAVLDLVRKQYTVDEDRVYLLGHSMGAIGSWYLGAKYPDRWAALAVFAGLGTPATESRMKHIAQFVVHGDADATVPVMGSRAMVAQMKLLGVEHQYIEVPGGTHMDVVEPNLKAAFDFFDAHRRSKVKPAGD